VSKTEDRIAAWRARREQQAVARESHGDLPIEYAVIAAKAEALGAGGDEKAQPILAMVLESLRSERHETVGERRRIYDAIARGFERGVDSGDPQSEYAELRRRQLRTIIRLIEADARAGDQSDFDEDYRPAGLDEALKPLLQGYRRRRKRADQEQISRARRQAVLADEAYTIAVPEEEEGDLLYLRELLAEVDAGKTSKPRRDYPKLRAFGALLRYQFVLLRSESRVALIWTLIGPAVLMALLMSGYFLAGIHSVLNMDVPTFAMLGSTSWFMLRQIIFRSTAAVHALRTLLNLRPYTPAMLGLGQGLIYMCAYTRVYISLIGGGYLGGLFTLPDNVPGVALWLTCIGLMALALGTIFGSIAVIWPYFSRFAPVIERALQMVSSVILVSEQLPVQYRWIVLWSPLAHAEQLLRSAYFEGYKSEDADPRYFFIWLGCVTLVAFVSQRLVRSRSVPG
jgi:capsular polysaccharide transport system permease protein